MVLSGRVGSSLELFHLELLRNLRQRPGRFEYVLKGGTNLRFFHGSVRYSQDADLDVLTGSLDDAQEEVRRTLAAGALLKTLAAHDIAIIDQVMSKQTETTQRWKFGLQVQLGTRAGTRLAIPTRIEFSARQELLDYLGESREDFVAGIVVRPHQIISPLVRHYLAAPAMVQKVRSLAERQQVQARDVFDLELLFRTNPEIPLAGRIDETKVHQAIERTADISFDAYQTQVVAFLEEVYVEQHDDPRQWEHIQLSVIESLERLLR
jgi:predicted nucleotidyltransferase component of viral defense system